VLGTAWVFVAGVLLAAFSPGYMVTSTPRIVLRRSTNGVVER
jgi:hypothetical protein